MSTTSKTPPPYRQIRAHQPTPDTIIVYQAYRASIATPAIAQQKLDASPDFKYGRMTWVKPSWAWMLYRAGYSHKNTGQEHILALTMKTGHFLELLERGVLSSHKDGSVLPVAPGETGATGAEGEEATKGAEAVEEVVIGVLVEKEVEGNNTTIDTLDIPTRTNDGERRVNTPSTSGGLKPEQNPDIGTKGQKTRKQKLQLPPTPRTKVVSTRVRIQWDPERTYRLERLGHRSIQVGIPNGLSKKWTNDWIIKIEDVTERARKLKEVLDQRENVTDEELVEMGLVLVETPVEVSQEMRRRLEMG